MSLAAADIEAIERATLDAVPPEQTAVLDGWLLGLDRGTVGRAHSAVPLTHDGCDAAVLTGPCGLCGAKAMRWASASAAMRFAALRPPQ